MYKTIVAFNDLQDNRHEYKVGDTFPREGVEPSEERLKELSSAENKRGKVLIELVGETENKEDDTELTVADMKAQLDERGIEYKKNAKKEDLLALLGE
jgi:T4 recombination endonuclease VII, dimerisation.